MKFRYNARDPAARSPIREPQDIDPRAPIRYNDISGLWGPLSLGKFTGTGINEQQVPNEPKKRPTLACELLALLESVENRAHKGQAGLALP